MLRVKVPAGKLSPHELRAIGETSNLFGKGDGELSTRQNIQLHWLELAKLPDVFAHLEAAGIDHRRRLRRHRPQHHRLPRPGPRGRRALRLQARSSTRRPTQFYGNPDWANLPRKHKYSIAACADRCNAPEINCISLIGTVTTTAARASPSSSAAASPRCRGSRRTWASSSPRRTRTRSSARSRSVWSEDLKYRVSRVKARLKFMVDDIGPEGIRERVEAKLGKKLEDYTLPPIDGRAVAPHRRARAEAGGALVHRRAGAPRPRSAATR